MLLLLIEHAILFVPVQSHPLERVSPVLIFAFVHELALLIRARSRLRHDRVVPILQTVAVIEFFVEPLEALDLFILRPKDLSLIVELSQLLILHQC